MAILPLGGGRRGWARGRSLDCLLLRDTPSLSCPTAQLTACVLRGYSAIAIQILLEKVRLTGKVVVLVQLIGLVAHELQLIQYIDSIAFFPCSRSRAVGPCTGKQVPGGIQGGDMNVSFTANAGGALRAIMGPRGISEKSGGMGVFLDNIRGHRLTLHNGARWVASRLSFTGIPMSDSLLQCS